MSTSNVIQLPRPEPRARLESLAVLDVGTSKMCGVIARRRGGSSSSARQIVDQQGDRMVG